MTVTDAISRAGNSPNQKEKEPEKLDDKTGRLEKRLMLRQFLTKALDIKRAEIAECAGQVDPEQSSIMPQASSIQSSPRKLTFYDVVQLARQQAFAEKTRGSDSDLIDLSEISETAILRPTVSSAQSDLTLLDLSSPMQYESLSPEPSFPELAELDVSTETAKRQTSVAELDAAIPPNPLSSDDAMPIELDATGVNDSKQEIKGIQNQPKTQVYGLGKTQISPSEYLDQPCLETTRTQSFPTSHPDIKQTVEIGPSPVDGALPRLTQKSNITSSRLSDESVEVKSMASTAPPSIFSHSSSLTGATGSSSLPGITEEDMQARNMLGILSSPSMNVTPQASLIRKTPADNTIPEEKLSLNSPPSNHETLVKPQRTYSEDSVFQSTPRPLHSEIDLPDEQGFPWIVQAARDGNEELVRKLLISGADIQAVHRSARRNALSEASLRGHQKIVNLLLDEGCSMEQIDVEGNTALHHACQQGHLAVAKNLIIRGAPIDTPGSGGRSALHLAMEPPTYQNIVMLLIQHRANVNARDSSFRTPLHIGAWQGNVAMCSHLLNEGAQLDAREAQSKTALHIACEMGHYELVQMMLDQSQLQPTNMTFLAAFFASVEYGHVRIAESFFSRGLKLQDLKRDLHKPLTLAAKSGYLAMVELMIHENCEVNARDDSGWNALHCASHHGHYQVIERLFTSGVSTKATTSRKETPLLLAVKGNHFPVAERLLRNGNNSSLVNLEDERGQKPIHHAVRTGSLETFNLIMSNGGKVSEENSFGWQPLHIATAYGHLSLVEGLLQYGAKVEEKLGSSSIKKDQTHKIVEEGYWAEARWPYPGSRALHLACEYGHEEIANLLISRGAKLESSCDEGWQPLHHAAFFGSSSLVEILLQGGASPHATTNEGKTAASLGFRATDPPIPEDDKAYIQNLLRESMNKAKKQRNFKVGLKKASTVEDKNNLLRTAAFSMMVVSRPQLQKAKTTAQPSHRASMSPDLSSNSQRPRLQHLPYTSPLPATDVAANSTSHVAVTPILPTSQSEVKIPTLPSTSDLSRQSTNTAAPTTSNSIIDQAPQSGTTATTTTTASSAPEATQSLAQPTSLLKRRTTFGLTTKNKSSADSPTAKLTLASIGKPNLEIGTKTLEIGKQGVDLTKQGLDLGKKGVGAIQAQGVEIGKQSREMGKRGVDGSKRVFGSAKKIVVGKGRLGGGGKKGKEGKGKSDSAEGTKAGEAKAIGDGDDNEDDEDNDDDEGDDDAKSVFSLGGFGEVDKNGERAAK